MWQAQAVFNTKHSSQGCGWHKAEFCRSAELQGVPADMAAHLERYMAHANAVKQAGTVQAQSVLPDSW
jgi:hypothetical protein